MDVQARMSRAVPTFRSYRTVIVVLLCLGVLAACAGGEQESPTTTAEDQTAEGQTAEDATTGEGEPAGGDPDDEPIPIRIGNLGFPSLVAPIPAIIEEHGIDEEVGLDMELSYHTEIGPYQAAFATDQVDGLVSGPHILHGLHLDGVPLQVVSSYVGLDPMVVVTADEEIDSVEDLVGRSLAATVASSEFDALSLYALSKGIDLVEDTDLVNAAPAEVRTQLEAGRVDAGLLWEPGATLALTDNEDYRVILNGAEAWEELTGSNGWELVWILRQDFLEEHPEAAERWVAALQRAVELLYDDHPEAGRLMEEATGMPAEAFESVLEGGRVNYDVRPAWEPEVRETIWSHFELAVDMGVQEELPDESVIFDPSDS